MQNAEYTAIKSFTDLNTWKEGHQLVLAIYKMTKLFPSDEKFGLINQIQRASVSITSNIAEGFSRHSNKEKIQFYYTALGSLTEVQNQLLISSDLEYIDSSLFNEISQKTVIVSKLLNGLIKSVKKKHNT
ncbi:four helix bundle protein [Candidatus Daviesbacteria bacterium]|nr:four helix bundle protein [Candidatus Daviesbacteria bacterium]